MTSQNLASTNLSAIVNSHCCAGYCAGDFSPYGAIALCAMGVIAAFCELRLLMLPLPTSLLKGVGGVCEYTTPRPLFASKARMRLVKRYSIAIDVLG